MLLALESSDRLCATCLIDKTTGAIAASKTIDIGRGHAEKMMGLISEVLDAAKIDYKALTGLAVCVGPGSFTGIRVGVAAARGLALALKIPALGVTTLSAIAEEARAAYPARRIIASIDARRDELYVEDHAPHGSLSFGPAIVNVADAGRLLPGLPPVLAGSGSDILAPLDQSGTVERAAGGATADIAVYARLAAAGRFHGSPPKPLYLRGPDARPQDGFALARKVS